MGALMKFYDFQLLKPWGKYLLPQLRNFVEKNKPTTSKRPPSAFAMYLKDRKELITEKSSSSDPKNVMKIASDMWRNESDSLHQQYKQKYTQEMNEYKQNLPVIPKRPPTPFILFSNDQANALRNKYPEIAKRSKVVSEMWSNLSHSEKEQYAKLYKEKMILYQESLTDEDKEVIKEKKSKSNERKANKELKKYGQKALSGRPVPPSNPWLLYLKENILSVPQGENKFAFLSHKWNGLTAYEKAVYEEKYHVLKRQYEKDLLQWQQKYT